MKAIKQTLKVENHKVFITLPEDFDAEEVEVIVFSKEDDYGLPDDFEISDEQKVILDERAKEPDENYISAEESLERLKRKHGV